MPNNMTLRCVIEKNVTTMSSDFGWSNKGPEDLVQKKHEFIWKIMEVFIVIYCDFLWFLVIYCDFLWFIVIYRDLVWFHENSWV